MSEVRDPSAGGFGSFGGARFTSFADLFDPDELEEYFQ
jgi:hypothetical protein